MRSAALQTRGGMSKQLGVANQVQDKLIRELYNAGLNIYRISTALDLPINIVREAFGGTVEPYPKKPIDENLVDKILYENNYPVALEIVISNEKERYAEYSKLEQNCLNIMNKLLSYYASQPIGVDIRSDQFTAKLASDFIKATHSARQELIQKYAIDKQMEEREMLKVEFIDSDTKGV